MAVKRYISRLVVSAAPTEGIFECADGRKFERTGDQVFAGLLLESSYETELTSVARRLVRRGDTVVDLGANFGWYTITLGIAVGSTGKVHAFEPVDESFQLLQRNIELNALDDVVTAYQAAVGAQQGWVEMHTSTTHAHSALAYATPSHEAASATRMLSLDEALAPSISDIAFVKIDIEGFEDEALVGAPSILGAEHQPVIQIELNSEALDRAGSSREKVLDRLERHGYSFFEVDRDLRLVSACPTASDVFARPGTGRYATRFDQSIDSELRSPATSD